TEVWSLREERNATAVTRMKYARQMIKSIEVYMRLRLPSCSLKCGQHSKETRHRNVERNCECNITLALVRFRLVTFLARGTREAFGVRGASSALSRHRFKSAGKPVALHTLRNGCAQPRTRTSKLA